MLPAHVLLNERMILTLGSQTAGPPEGAVGWGRFGGLHPDSFIALICGSGLTHLRIGLWDSRAPLRERPWPGRAGGLGLGADPSSGGGEQVEGSAGSEQAWVDWVEGN